jgi:hypothetical protein
MGFCVGDIGTHLICIGAVTYLALLPGGPPAASTSICAGWTMVFMKYIYMRYVTSGDQFVGRCHALLSVLRMDFAVSPPHFVLEDYIWIDELWLLQCPMVGLIVGFKKVTCMCLAYLMYPHVWLNDSLISNHVVLSSSHLQHLELFAIEMWLLYFVVSMEWSNTCVFWDSATHFCFARIIPDKKQKRLIGEFVGEVLGLIDRLGGDGGRL